MSVVFMLCGIVLSFIASFCISLGFIQFMLSLQRRSLWLVQRSHRSLFDRMQDFMLSYAQRLEGDAYQKNRFSLICLIVMGLIFLLLRAPFTLAGIMGLAAYGLSRYLPRLLVQQKERERIEQAIAELPNLIDIVALGMSAGISFDSALELYCMRSNSALSKRMFEALHSWKNGIYTRREVFDQLCREYEFDGMRHFCDSVHESLSFGVPLSKSLEEQSIKMRKEHQTYVQEKIEKAPVKMLIPIGVLILPAMLLTIAGPLLASALMTSS